MQLSPVQQKFVLHWGEMGTRWGINRTVAQIHALLYISPNSLHAEEIAETLAVARSNVSNSLKELQNWGIVKMVHVMGDKRDHFESCREVWEMFRIVVDERKRREMDPDKTTRERLAAMLEFFETTGGWYEQVRKWPTATLLKFMKLGDKAMKWLG
jgi:DNA-binding transcriptional regulator GbsR (MarR family)